MSIRSVSEKYWVYVFVFFIVISVANIANMVFFSNHREKTEEEISQEIIYAPPSQSDHYKIKNVNARVTIINYFSLDCFYCKKLHALEEEFIKSYPESVENINIIYRHNPLEIYPLSQEKALISECVYRQGGDIAFFKFVKKVFESNESFSKNNAPVKTIAYEQVSSRKQMDVCLEDKAVKEVIQRQKVENIFTGISSTPTFLVFIDGKFIKKYENVGGKVGIEIIKYYADKNNIVSDSR